MPLRLRGENQFAVPALSLPAQRTPGSAVSASQFEAIQLFVERARAVKHDFRLTDDNAASVAEICRRLDGLPLAIELATARLTLFSPETLLDRLRSGIKVLGGGARDLPARQQTLKATIDWSFQLLEPSEQRLLELLSVFVGGSFEAIEAVAGGLEDSTVDIDVLDGVASLVDKSLIRQVELRDGESGGTGVRIGMLETIREYASERIANSADFELAARRQHATYYTTFAAAEWKTISSGGRMEDHQRR